ncbi:MAG: hypothetical protein M9894_05035 [Planctomycetes bacterium]|nr:hypothetical protein [Planctomycetota bacterium]
MPCPDPIELSRHADGDVAVSDGDRRALERHLRECAACREAVDDDLAVALALGKAPCPDAESLALFIDDDLGPPRLDLVAAHVLACAPCREVVAWTREAAHKADERQGERVGARSGRRRARIRPRSAIPGWVPALVGAAAAVLIVAIIIGPDRTSPDPQQARTPEPQRTPTPTPPAPEPERPRPPAPDAEVVAPPPAVIPDEPAPDTTEVEPPPPPAPTTPAPTPATPDPAPAPTTAPTPAPAAPAPTPVQVAALAGAPLRYRAPDGAEGELSGATSLPAGTRLVAGRQGGALRVGDAACFVDAQGALALREPAGDVTRVEVLEGQVSFDAPRPSIEVACGPAVVRPAAAGVYMVVATDGPERALLCVVSGEAVLGGAHAQAGRLGPGDAARIDRDRVRPARDARVARAEDLATAAALAQGVDFPGGVRVRRVLAAAAGDLAHADAERRAWAAYAVLSVAGAGPRLARLAEPHLPQARRALDDLLALPPDARAAAPLVLALAAGGRGDGVATLAEALAARPPLDLAQDVEALLALRVAERLTSFRAPRPVWAAAAAQPLEGPSAGARAALARRPLDAAARRQVLADLDARLAQDPLASPLEPAAVLQAERSLALIGALTDERRARLLGHAGAPDRADPRLAIAAAHDTARAVGQPDPTRADAPASIVVVPQPDGRFRVTFVFSSPRRPKQALLHGSWDQWAEPGVALRERADGTFTATLLLPAGRHEYKVRLGVGGVWEHDAGNPLTTADGMGGINSVLLLE